MSKSTFIILTLRKVEEILFGKHSAITSNVSFMSVLHMPENNDLGLNLNQSRILVLEPYAVKTARAVLRGGKSVRIYLSQ
jgi:putative methionine-R-sulfoxide reductase with GAF domain